MNLTVEVLRKIVALDFPYPAPLALRRKMQEGLPEPRQAAAVCILFKGKIFEEAEILLTERSTELSTHAGQVAFPGGVLDPVDAGDAAHAALRESQEEVGVKVENIQVIGSLPPFPTILGNFEVAPILAFWVDPELPELKLSSEVTAAEWVSVKDLFQSRKTEVRMVQDVEVESPFFWWGNRKMWGVSAWIFDLIYHRYDRLKGKENP